MVDILNIKEEDAYKLGCHEEWKRCQDAVRKMAEEFREEIDRKVLEEVFKSGYMK